MKRFGLIPEKPTTANRTMAANRAKAAKLFGLKDKPITKADVRNGIKQALYFVPGFGTGLAANDMYHEPNFWNGLGLALSLLGDAGVAAKGVGNVRKSLGSTRGFGNVNEAAINELFPAVSAERQAPHIMYQPKWIKNSTIPTTSAKVGEATKRVKKLPIFDRLRTSGRFDNWVSGEREPSILSTDYGDFEQLGLLRTSDVDKDMFVPYMRQQIEAKIGRPLTREEKIELRKLTTKPAYLLAAPDGVGNLGGWHNVPSGNSYIPVRGLSTPSGLGSTYVHEQIGHGTDEFIERLSKQAVGEYSNLLHDMPFTPAIDTSKNWYELRATMLEARKDLMKRLRRAGKFKGDKMTPENAKIFQDAVNNLTNSEVASLYRKQNGYGADYARHILEDVWAAIEYKQLLSRGLGISAPIGVGAYLKKNLGTASPSDVYRTGGAIHINPANRGKFTATMRRTGKTAEELSHSSNPLTRKRAIFALNARKWNK